MAFNNPVLAALQTKSTADTGELTSGSEKKSAFAAIWKGLQADPGIDNKIRSRLISIIAPSNPIDFVDKRDEGAPSFGDDSLPVESSAIVRTPIRMFDIDTGNLVEYPDASWPAMYCMLSHSWKGSEITLHDIRRAKQLEAERVPYGEDISGKSEHEQLLSESRGQQFGYAKSAAQQNDVDLIKAQCEEDIAKQHGKITALIKAFLDGSETVGELLVRRIKSKNLESDLAKAQKHVDSETAKLEYSSLEVQVFDKLMEDMKMSEEQRATVNKADDLNECSEALDKAQKKRAEEQGRHDDLRNDVEFFKSHGRIREALDELTIMLQRRKSATKIEQSIEHAKRIFNTKMFPTGGKRYLWNDTCCINKAIASELAEAIALMGEWYSNAEFCLVHLDSRRSEDDWITEWNGEKPSDKISGFETIFDDETKEGPEWSERGWTLQELVLSKLTYYVNSWWEPLERPIEDLGPYYYLSIYLRQYVRGVKASDDTQLSTIKINDTNVLDNLVKTFENKHQLSEAGRDIGAHGRSHDTGAILAIQRAQKIIAIIEYLGVDLPKHVDATTVRAQINESVHRAVRRLSLQLRKDQPPESNRGGIDSLLGCLGLPIEPSDISIKMLIDFLLSSLVDQTRVLVDADMREIAKFGKVQVLEGWTKGNDELKVQASDILSLASTRTTTVLTDKAYSLMGILGVQFPVSPGESLTKALSRLIDEVVTTSNDISVFNWSGRQLGSPIRGRSLYPLNLDAFDARKTDSGNQSEKNRRLAHLLSRERLEMSKTFDTLIDLLDETTRFIQESKGKPIRADWIQLVTKAIRESGIAQLGLHLKTLWKVTGYIQTSDALPSLETVDRNDAEPLGKPDGREKAASERSGIDAPLVDQSTAKPSGLMSMGKGVASNFSLGSKSNKSSKLKSPTFERPSFKTFDSLRRPVDSGVSAMVSTISSITPTSESFKGPVSHGIRELVHYLRDLDSVKPDNIPTEVMEELKGYTVPAKFKEPLASRSPEQSKVATHAISPNPINITPSGIRAVFDIQRVIVTILQPEKIRTRIAQATSPNEKISGWCTISTGFARTVVGFTCEKNKLLEQLNIGLVVKKLVLEEPPSARKKLAEFGRSKSDQVLSAKKLLLDRSKQQDSQATSQSDREAAEALVDRIAYGGNSEEGRRVVRMIDWVQQADIDEIAGEWVLARFSGVSGANWFLCHLEPGTGKSYHGHRIPTDEIDFHDASPEKGLIDHWKSYMNVKKSELCRILDKYLESHALGQTMSHIEQALGSNQDDDSDSDGDTQSATSINSLEKRATVEATGMMKKFVEHRAKRLYEGLNETALKGVPVHLRAAVENLNNNKSLLPAMFLSSRELHVF